MVIWFLMDRLASCVFLKVFCLLIKPHGTTAVDCHIIFIVKQHMHQNVWLAERSRAHACIATYDLLSTHAPALWRQDQYVSLENKPILSSLWKKILMLKHNVKMMKSMSIWIGRSRDSRQANFFLVSLISLYSLGHLNNTYQILSWASRKLAWVSQILYGTYKGHFFSGECSRNFISHTEQATSHYLKQWWPSLLMPMYATQPL